mgnify:CR=1 FL=1
MKVIILNFKKQSIMKKTVAFILFICLSTNIYSQQKEASIIKIKNTLQNYFNGYIERDINKLNKAFDIKNGTMKVPILKNNKTIGYQNKYFKDLMPIWGNRKKLSQKVLKNCSFKILNIDIVDEKIASAKISMKVDTVTYIDIVSLQKIKDNWKITNKIYVTRK